MMCNYADVLEYKCIQTCRSKELREVNLAIPLFLCCPAISLVLSALNLFLPVPSPLDRQQP
ncbi:hypothetical protein DL98DRAFT_264984 [Cadophora sp. DSE1049]|nr:hypothetical protein DL98DRAFT_264984 [Cadophora sp. DSE1049]